MKYLYLIIILLSLNILGCSRAKKSSGMPSEVYCTDDAKETGDIRDVFSSVELIPLEFTGAYYPYFYDLCKPKLIK